MLRNGQIRLKPKAPWPVSIPHDDFMGVFISPPFIHSDGGSRRFSLQITGLKDIVSPRALDLIEADVFDLGSFNLGLALRAERAHVRDNVLRSDFLAREH